MKQSRPPIIGTLLRSLRLRCPVCGLASVVERPFKVKHHCPACDALFQREAGFFVGAILVNVVTTEAFILAVYVACLVAGLDYQLLLALLFAAALLFPVAFYHHSWSIWLGFDHLVERLPRNAGQTGQTGR
ncbi:MAG TPA: DUF983 domain-containing protein [Pyrinomonadaceae bacterium]|nr:DUF983 domain-containing protein [Pyrinomonadaceae bacterium]